MDRAIILAELFQQLFKKNGTLEAFLLGYPYEHSTRLVTDLINPDHASRASFTLDAAKEVVGHNIGDKAFFEALKEKFPQQAASIQSTAREFVSGEGITSVPGFEYEPSEGLDVALYEKVMEDVPTFMDVSFLALGVVRATSVVKLRMTFSDSEYAGTAFLISPHMLLTCYHNIWNRFGEKATALELVWDYELGIDGFEKQPTRTSLNPDAVIGMKNDDWAILTLSDRSDRQPSPLSETVARVDSRVTIIQHPAGRRKQIALHHNLVTAVGDGRVQYMTDTEAGSSGSPVYDEKWNVVALHQGGGELKVPGLDATAYRNQGIDIVRVKERLREEGVVLN